MMRNFKLRSMLARGILAIAALTTLAGGLPSPAAAEPEANKTLYDKVDEFMNEAVEKLRLPGAAIGIVKGDRVLYSKGYGISGPDRQPVTPQTPFVLGSTSKSITALAVMQLVEAGKIDLEAPVQRYLPWFRLADEEASKGILVKHLLFQTSGLSTHSGQVSLTRGDKPLEEHLKSLRNTSLASPVGSAYQYSNLNYDILGGIVEAVSGMPFGQYVKESIFAPLGMTSSYPSAEEAPAGEVATGYQPVLGFMVPTKQAHHPGTTPSGYLVSSAADMSNYLIAQMNGGRYKDREVLSEAGVNRMHAPAAYMWDGMHYAMGWTTGGGVVSHDGSTENTYSKMMIDGEYGIVLLINAMDFFHIDSYDAILTGIRSLVHDRPPVPVPSDYTRIFAILNAILLVVAAAAVWSLFALFRRDPKAAGGPVRRVARILFIVAFYLLIPGAVLALVPRLLVPWPVVRLFLPGYGHALFLAPIAALALGAARLAVLARAGRRPRLVPMADRATLGPGGGPVGRPGARRS